MLSGALLTAPTARSPRPACAGALQPPGWLPDPPMQAADQRQVGLHPERKGDFACPRA